MDGVCSAVVPAGIFDQEIGTGSDDVEPVAHVNVAASFVDTAALRGCVTNAPFTDHTIATTPQQLQQVDIASVAAKRYAPPALPLKTAQSIRECFYK